MLHEKGDIDAFGLIGCGLINREIARFIATLGRKVGQILAYDIDPQRGRRFADSLASDFPGIPVRVGDSAEAVMSKVALVSFATTAVKPTVSDISECRPGTTILHISLRDLLLNIRFSFDLYINIRPFEILPGLTTPLRDKGPADVNMLFIRENSEGEYSGVCGRLRKVFGEYHPADGV